MAHEYRFLAKEHLSKAEKLLATRGDDELIYACLELRKCVEAIAFETFTSYLEEVPLRAFEVWQPDKVIKELIRIDPEAGTTRTLSMQRSASDTEPAGDWKEIGEDRRLKANRASKIFNSLGFHLHVPMIKQIRQGRKDLSGLRASAEKYCAELKHVLSATIWNANFGTTVTVSCTECETPIKRKVEVLREERQIECGNCGQHFNVSKTNDEWFFEPILFYWHCDGCGKQREIAESKARANLDVSCPDCKHPAILASVTSWRVKQAPKPDPDSQE